jgi:predicted dehydrogenase
MGLEHAARINRARGLELAGFVHPDGRGRVQPGFEGIPVESSVEALARRTKIDGAIIATPNRQHVDDVEQCAALRLPMLVEKPMADTLVGALAAVKAIEGSGVPALIGYHRIYSPVIEEAAAILASGELGRPVCVRGCAKYLKPAAYFEPRGWRTEAGGGPLKINFVHDIASMTRLLGPVEAVQAMASSRIRGFDVEDTAAITFCFASGVLGSFLVSDCVASCESWESATCDNPRFPHYPMEACYEISGTSGSLKVPNLEVISADAENPSWESPFRRAAIGIVQADPWDRQLAHFADVIAGAAAPRVTARFGLHVAAIGSAIDRSIATGARAFVPAAFPETN